MDNKMRPLADRMRPTELSEIVGQKHILGEGKILNRIAKSKNIPNMIFYGPAGTGKTTVANIMARISDKKFYKLNATNASVSDIKSIVSDIGSFDAQGGILLYLDEIQNFNKKQQQSLLEFVENGDITLISSTTENPYFYVFGAILSRCSIFEFKRVEPEDIEEAVYRAVDVLRGDYPEKDISIQKDAAVHISNSCGGDVRRAITSVELSVLSLLSEDKIDISLETAVEATGKKALNYDRDGDNHYDILSALQKSVRGSDINAALHYAARLIEAGDLQSLCRRIMVMASEDVGLAYPQAVSITKSCIDAALMLGLPEARLPIAEAVIMLAGAPKSNSVICAIDNAIAALPMGGAIPDHLRDSHYGGAKKLGHGQTYKYPHDYPNNYVEQQYLPDSIKDVKFYTPGNNKFEQGIKEYWDKIK